MQSFTDNAHTLMFSRGRSRRYGFSFAILQFLISNYVNPWIVDIGALDAQSISFLLQRRIGSVTKARSRGYYSGSVALTCLVGLFVTLQAYVHPFSATVLHD